MWASGAWGKWGHHAEGRGSRPQTCCLVPSTIITHQPRTRPHLRPPEALHDSATYEAYLMHRVAIGDAEGLASGLFPLEYAATAQVGYRV
jgi:hypothetical protein